MSEVVVILGRIRHISQIALLWLFGLIIVIIYLTRLRDWLQTRNK